MPIKIAGIHQPNYLPWPGYFHKIMRSDVFIILDNVDFQQGNSKSITSRTKIKGANGETLLSVPVKHTEDKLLRNIQIDNSQTWAKKHIKSIQFSYTKAPYFKTYYPLMEKILLESCSGLFELNYRIIKEVCSILEIPTQLLVASEMQIEEEDRNLRIVKLCASAGANAYLCGKGGRSYMDENVFTDNGIEVMYTAFNPPEYPQLHGAFLPGLSVLDALMNTGKAGVCELIR
ncbi:MAG TPA: WbqC family protein [Bacteroidia bacterium]|jgi:hypothetical protein|nr:WbqC family protein [Bacteroidia bacterium]